MASRRSALAVAASLYWGIANGDSGAAGFFRGLVATQASERRLELGAKALAVEVGELGLVAGVGVHPLCEQRDDRSPSAVGEVSVGASTHASGDRGALGPRLLAVPARRLVRRPGGRDRRHASSTVASELEVALERSCFASSIRTDRARPGRRTGGAVSPVAARALSSIRSDRSIATGDIRPRPARYGLSSALIASEREHDHRGRRSHQHRLGVRASPRCRRRTA